LEHRRCSSGYPERGASERNTLGEIPHPPQLKDAEQEQRCLRDQKQPWILVQFGRTPIAARAAAQQLSYSAINSPAGGDAHPAKRFRFVTPGRLSGVQSLGQSSLRSALAQTRRAVSGWYIDRRSSGSSGDERSRLVP
jgi:hypothetical protein